MEDDNNNNANLPAKTLAAIVELGQNLGKPVRSERIHYALVPIGTTLQSLKDFQYPHGLPPDRIKATVQLLDAKSFCYYVATYNAGAAAIFANPATQSFLAVLDYHEALDRQAAFCDHKAIFQMKQSEQWRTWTANHGKAMSQTDFAEFVEDNMGDFLNPDAATMLEIARDIQAKVDVNFASQIRLSNGQTQLKYNETVAASVGTGNLEVPESFTLKIPVFYGEDPVSVRVRLRFRIPQGKLSFLYKMDNPADTLLKAFESAVLSVQDTLKTEVLFGTI